MVSDGSGHSGGHVSPRWLGEHHESLGSRPVNPQPLYGRLLGWLGLPCVLSHLEVLPLWLRGTRLAQCHLQPFLFMEV